MKNSTQKTLLIVAGILLAIVGVVALIEPTKVTALLIYFIGLAVLLSGVATAVTAFSHHFKESRNMLLALALSNVVLGVLIMLINNVFVLLFGIGVMVVGCSLAVAALQLKKEGSKWLTTMCLAIITIIIGLTLMLFFKHIQAAIGIILGVGLLAAGAILTIIAVTLPKAKETGV